MPSSTQSSTCYLQAGLTPALVISEIANESNFAVCNQILRMLLKDMGDYNSYAFSNAFQGLLLLKDTAEDFLYENLVRSSSQKMSPHTVVAAYSLINLLSLWLTCGIELTAWYPGFLRDADR